MASLEAGTCTDLTCSSPYKIYTSRVEQIEDLTTHCLSVNPIGCWQTKTPCCSALSKSLEQMEFSVGGLDAWVLQGTCNNALAPEVMGMHTCRLQPTAHQHGSMSACIHFPHGSMSCPGPTCALNACSWHMLHEHDPLFRLIRTMISINKHASNKVSSAYSYVLCMAESL